MCVCVRMNTDGVLEVLDTGLIIARVCEYLVFIHFKSGEVCNVLKNISHRHRTPSYLLLFAKYAMWPPARPQRVFDD